MASGSTAPAETDDYEPLISMPDVEHLKRVWRREKAAPEIFQFEFALIGRIREQIELMVRSKLLIPVWFPRKSRVRKIKHQSFFITLFSSF